MSLLSKWGEIVARDRALRRDHWMAMPVWVRHYTMFVALPAWVVFAIGVISDRFERHPAVLWVTFGQFALAALLQTTFLIRAYWGMEL